MGPTDGQTTYCGWNIDDIWFTGTPMLMAGDLNCDGVVNFDDIDPFVLAMGGEDAYRAEYPSCHWLNADCNDDHAVDFDDIDAFVALLGG